MSLPRGFKTRANAIARQVRVTLRLAPWDPLDPRKLAEQRGIEVTTLTSFEEILPHRVRRLRDEDPTAFSAFTIQEGTARLMVLNDAHSAVRQNADTSHELAHDILKHPVRPIMDLRGCRDLDQDVEEEANWLGPALLVSEEAALHIARQGHPIPKAAALYGVSEQVMRFRMNVTAAYKRVA